MNIDRERALETFDDFLMLMDGQLAWLIDQAQARGVDLDGRVESLDRLEELHDVMAATLDEDECSALHVVFARYLGECVRTCHGGQRMLPLDDPKDVNFNMPVIIGHSSCTWLEFNPIHTIRSYSLRPYAGKIRDIVKHSVAPAILDLSDLTDE